MVAGIVAEYNPFHGGHLRHIEAIRAAAGEDTPIVAVLSGDFVQRGEAAVFSKSARAEAAVRCGVSLVLELPLPWSLSSAEGFARGGIGLLTASGVVDTVSFGSESGDLAELVKCAEALDSDSFRLALRDALTHGSSFASAREKAVRVLIGDGADVLRSPNDLLAVEYIRAAAAMKGELSFLPVKREGPAHDAPGSASDLRGRMREGDAWLRSVPENAAAVFRREQAEGRGPVLPGALSAAVMSRLRVLREEDMALLPDAAEGLDHRLFRAIQNSASPEEAAQAAKTKRYALSRLRRMVMCAALGVKKGDADGIPPYIRVLAMDRKGAALLRTMRRTASLPVITKPARVKDLDERSKAIFALTSWAHDLFALGYEDEKQHVALGDWRSSPAVIR